MANPLNERIRKTMAKKKYYAVRKGKTPGIYQTWDECKNQVDGFSGAEYKSFATQSEAEAYLGVDEKPSEGAVDIEAAIQGDALVAYVDGSYNDETKEFSYGIVILHKGKEEYFSEKVEDAELAEMRNVAGEIKGAEAAMRYAVKHQYRKLLIYHDYEGIAKWCTGEWKAKKYGTKAYQEYYNSVSNEIDIEFVKVVGHSNDKYNDMADELAKAAIFGTNKSIVLSNEDEDKMKVQNIYITRNIEELNDMLMNEGNRLWEDFSSEGIKNVGKHKRFTFTVSGKEAMLDIYQKGDGSTTFRATGNNAEYSQALKEAIEKQGVRNTSENKNYSVFLGEEWLGKTIDFLKQLPDVDNTENDNGDRTIFQFTSKYGDKLTLAAFKNFNVTVQGKPLYLYNEFCSFISLAPAITVNDVVDMTNAFNDTELGASDTRAKMSQLLPNAYNSDKIDDTIWKLFSPSVVLIEDNKTMDDYSCCVFPALRALEGYLKFLLVQKNIVVDKKHNFGSIFKPNDDSKFVLHDIHKKVTKDSKYEEALEELYNYFHGSRHVLFHVDQILIATKLIEEKQEAKDIFYAVINLIENTFVKIENQLNIN